MMNPMATRRKLLKILGASALASSTYSSRIFALSQQEKLGVALVGLGYYSRDLLAPALQITRYCELKGIVTGSPEKIPVWQKKYGIRDANVYSYETMHELANNDEIDVVYVVVPTALHKKYSLVAAASGKHVWCEKPMAMTVEDCASIIKSCNKNKVKLTVGYRMLHEPNTQTLIGYANSKPYGKAKHVVAEAGYAGGAPAAGDWRLSRAMGGGALYDMGVYPINAARNMIGEEPSSIAATLEVQRKKIFTEVDETCLFTLSFPSGAQASCMASVGKSVNVLKVDCKEGWYKLEPFQSYSGVTGVTSSGLKLNKEIHNQQAKQMDDDSLAIINNTSVIVPGTEGIHDIRVVQAAIRSAASGGKTIDI